MSEKIPTNKSNRFDVARLYRLACKELVEILRDRRTIITLVLMPLLVYPLMGIVVQKLVLQSFSDSTEIVYNIGFDNEEHAEAFSELLLVGENKIQLLEAEQEELVGEEPETGSQAIERRIQNAIEKQQKPSIKYFVSSDLSLDKLVRLGDIDLGVSLVTDRNDNTVRFVYDSQNSYSIQAMRFVQKRVRYANEVLSEKIGEAVRAKLPQLVKIRETPVASESQQPVLLTFVPLMLVLMTITGAVYPAIDLTAGERERGTMEILVAAPVSRIVVLFGKFVAVLTVAILTAIANLIAMTVTVYSLGLDSLIFGDAVFSFGTVVVIFVLLVVLASFFSATLLCLTSFARSFKEAQAYLIPLMLVAFAPGLLSLTPNLETSALLSVIPLVNIVLAGRDLLAGQANLVFVFISILSTIIYGLLALSLAAKIFGTDSILTGGKSSWSDLLSQPKERKDVPEIQTAIILLAILFPLFVTLAGLSSNMAGKLDLSISARLIINAIITVALFLGLPLLMAALSKSNVKTTFYLAPPHWLSVMSAILIGCSVWVLAYELEISILSEDRIEQFVKLFESMKVELSQIPLWVKLICLALVPAVCEEITFRGIMLSAIRRRVQATTAVVLTAVLFGLFHVFVRDALMFERMAPSTLMGLILGWLCIRSGSIFPGMLLHAIHNGLLITLSHFESELSRYGLGVTEQQHLPTKWILVALIPVVVGVSIVFLLRPTKLSTTTSVSSDS